MNLFLYIYTLITIPMKKVVVSICIFFIVLLSPSILKAAAGPGGPGGGMGPPTGCWPPGNPACIPIDGGITLLIAAGLAYGGKKTMQLRKK